MWVGLILFLLEGRETCTRQSDYGRVWWSQYSKYTDVRSVPLDRLVVSWISFSEFFIPDSFGSAISFRSQPLDVSWLSPVNSLDVTHSTQWEYPRIGLLEFLLLKQRLTDERQTWTCSNRRIGLTRWTFRTSIRIFSWLFESFSGAPTQALINNVCW